MYRTIPAPSHPFASLSRKLHDIGKGLLGIKYVSFFSTTFTRNTFFHGKYLVHYIPDTRRNAYRWRVRYCCPTLNITGMCRQILVKLPDIKIRENSFGGSGTVTRRQKGG
jgi:hypothetical protein